MLFLTDIPVLISFLFRCYLYQHQARFIPMPAVGGSSHNEQGPWPECLGRTGNECKNIIESMAPDVKGRIFIMPPNSMMTMDYRTDRVRVFVNEAGVVEKVPQRG